VQPEVSYSLRWEGETLWIELEEPLNPGTRYRFTVGAEAQDTLGVPLGADYRWVYHLPELVAEVAGPDEEYPNQALIIRCNYPLDVDVLQGKLRVSTPSQPDVPGEWNFVSETQLNFRPAEGYEYATTYRVHFPPDLRDIHGDPMPPPDEVAYTTPPPVASFSPLTGQVVDPYQPVTISFAVPVDRASAAQAFSLNPETPGEITWQGNTLLFTPSSAWEQYSEYTVTLGVSARREDGGPLLAEPFSWTFETGYLDSWTGVVVSFGEYGPNAQVLDLNGRRAVQFVTSPEAGQVDFDLYRLTLDQFLDRYSSGFRGVRGFERVSLDTSGAALQTSWAQPLAAPGAGWQNSIYETFVPEEVPAGLYILAARAGQASAQLMLVLTRNTMLVKQAEGELVAWVTDINGGPRPRVRVSVYARDGVLLAEGRADEYGVYRTHLERDPQPLIVVAQDSEALTGREIEGTDITVSGLSNEWQAGFSRWGGWWRSAPQAQDYAVYVYTDRPIYRPGQTLYYKAILRRDEDAALSLPPEGMPVTVRMRDARDNVVQSFEQSTNAFGTLAGEFKLAEGAMLGDYQVEVRLGEESHRQVFKVQDYRKPDFEIKLSSARQSYVAGDIVTVDIATDYFFGQPVPEPSLTFQHYTLRENWSWWGAEERDAPDYVWVGGYGEAKQGRGDADGAYTYTFLAEMDNSQVYAGWGTSLRQQTFGLEVTADDGTHQTVSAFVVYTVYNAPEKVELELDSWIAAPDKPIDVNGRLLTVQDEPLAGRQIRLELRRWDREARAYDDILQAIELETDANGRVQFPLRVPDPGFYQVRLKARMVNGEWVYNNRWVYVVGPGRGWASQFLEQIKISADRESYAPGDTARLVIESNFGGPALLTFERAATRRTLPVELTPPLTLVEVPIRADDAPNIFVTVNAWEAQDTHLSPDMWESLSDSRLRTASVELKVPVTDKTLAVTLTPDQESYAPRQEATFEIQVSDQDGNPAEAEVSLALVDEAIFSLSEDLAGPVFEAFYQDRPNIVRTYDSMSLLRSLYAPGLGGGGGDGGLIASPRSEFPDTAAWLPAVYTDESGRATVTIRLPDSLTSWRLTAKAVTREHQVGETSINLLTQQETVVRPILPRTVTTGDRLLLSALVHNYASEAREFKVTMTADPADPASSLLPLVVGEPREQVITLEPGEVRVVGWPAEALAAGEAAVTVRATPTSGPGGGDDAVRLLLPVRPLAIPEVFTEAGEFEGAFEAALVLPEDALDLSYYRLELTRSYAGNLLTGLEYLTGFPYGCVEQTMSKALPNAVIGRAFHQLGVGDPTLQADLPPKINAGLQRLYGYQHNDGGWGWWYDDASDVYQTAWVIFGLAVTAEAGYEVDPQVIQRGAEWLQGQIESSDLRTQAYARYSLAAAGYGDLNATQALAARAAELDTFSTAGLALALHTLGDQEGAQTLLDVLAESAVQREGLVYWPNPRDDGHYYEKTMASGLRSTALALDAFVRIRPGHPLEGGIVRWLVAQRGEHGWGTTNETSYAILALSDHLLSTEAATSDSPYEVRLNGETLSSGRLGRGEPVVTLELPAGMLQAGNNLLSVVSQGAGKMYYTLTGRMYFATPDIQPSGKIEVSRSYLDPETKEALTVVKPGQLVLVRVQVSLPEDAFFLIVEDPLPGGLEALNESLNTTSHVELAYGESPPTYWQEYGYNQKEVWGDRVVFFVTQMEAGTRIFSYLARATHAGEFVALPSEVSAMYDAALWGRSAGSSLEVAETP